MPQVYNVLNVEQAVDLAYKFKEEGKYDWFRGQTIDYVPHSTLFRRQITNNTENVDFQYYLFIDWLQEIPELRYLLDPSNVDELEAIMQHYGMPTHYIDFTTDPGIAGFFAADTKTPPIDRNSCIYCLDSSDLLSLWDILKSMEDRDGSQIKKVDIDVTNLWRLQAQRGVFLMCNYNLEVDYPLDKIVFPYTGYPSYPTKEIVYPKHKSALELLLDQFFDRERTAMIHKKFKDVADFFHYPSYPNGIHASSFKDPSKLITHTSWDKSKDGWHVYKNENFHQTTGVVQKLRLNNLESADEIRKIVSYGIKQILRSNPTIRQRTIDWLFEEVPDNITSATASDLLSKVWNGMRLLPFDNDDISEACGNTMYLYVKSGKDMPSTSRELEIFSSLFGNSMRVGFANEDHTGSCGYASFGSINHALEIDIQDIVTDECKEIALDTHHRFRIIYNPKIMFDFNKFKSFFAREVIPSQVAWDERLIVFNPSKLITFGIP